MGADVSVSLAWFGLMLLVVLSIAWLGAAAPPRSAVFAYLLTWVLLPKAFRFYYVTGSDDLPQGITVFTMVEAIVVMSIVVSLATRHRRMRSAAAAALCRLAWVLLGTGIVSAALSYWGLSFLGGGQLDELWASLASQAIWTERILPVLSMAYAVVVVHACVRFLRTERDIEYVFGILLLCGLELVTETVAFVLLGILPGLHEWAIHSSGRFMSLVFTDYDLTGEFLIVAVGAGLFFARSRRQARWWGATAALGFPVLATFQRSVLAGVGATVLGFFWLTIGPSRKKRLYVSVVAAVLVAALTLHVEQPAMEVIAGRLGREVRPEYWSMDTLEVRLGYWARAVDVIRFVFPCGVGPGLAYYALQHPVPQGFESLSPNAWLAYESLASRQRTTSVHNTFLEFVLENGLLGIVALGAFCWRVVSNFLGWRGAARRERRGWTRTSLAQASVYSILAGLAVNASFEPARLPYAIVLLLLWVGVLARGLEEARENIRRQRGTSRRVTSVQAAPPSWPDAAPRVAAD